MRLSIGVFERREHATTKWTTLGLGEHTRKADGLHVFKVRERIEDDVRKLVEATPAADVARFRLVPGVRLVHARLELVLDGDDGRRRVSGVFPLVVEPHFAGPGERLLLVYHPHRQDDCFWLALDKHAKLTLSDDALGELVPDRARAVLSRKWADLDDEELAKLGTPPHARDRLVVLGLSAEPKSALAMLPAKERDLGARGPQRKREGRGFKVLPRLGDDLTLRAARAQAGSAPTHVDPSVRHKLEALVGSRRPGGAVLVGAPGVGKTSAALAFTADLLASEDYAVHKDLDRVTHVWQVSGKRLIAGMSFVGEWEQRLLDLLDDAERRDVVLFVPDLARFGRIGRSRDSDRALADLVVGPLKRGSLRLFGEATPDEITDLERTAPELASLLTAIPVREATPSETVRILIAQLRAIELEGRGEVNPLAIRSIVESSRVATPGRAQPGCAIELLHELVRAPNEDKDTIGPWQVAHLLSKKTGLPPALLRFEIGLEPAEVERQLGAQVIGQPDAVRAAVDLVARIKAGLVDSGRPYGVYLLTGPTGTGKTELCKSIAEYLYGRASRLVRFDMSEFAGPDAPARLVGDSYRPEGLLTGRVAEQPHCVLLLDEIEKAHRSVLNLLLQLFEDGRLTDARGRSVDFTKTAVMMTSNLGAKARGTLGFGESPTAVLRDVAKAVRDFFPPEIFNRIDRVVPFAPLSPEVARAIATKELKRITSRRGLTERGVFVYVSHDVAELVAREAFRAEDGARSVKKYLEDKLGALLVHALAGSARAAMQVLRVSARDGAFVVEHEALAEAEPRAGALALDALVTRSFEALKRELEPALEFVRALEASDAAAHIAKSLEEHLAEYRRATLEGERGAAHAEAVFNLDAMAAALVAFRAKLEEIAAPPDSQDAYEDLEREQFGFVDLVANETESRYRLFSSAMTGRSRAKVTRADVLGALAEVQFLRRVLAKVAQPGEHAVVVEVRVAARPQTDARFEEPQAELFVELVSAYLGLRGEIGRVAWLEAKAPGGAAGEAAAAASVARASGRAAVAAAVASAKTRHVAFEVLGLGARDAFELEEGTHVLERGDGEVELVDVRVRPVSQGPLLEGPTPAAPALLPVVRRLRAALKALGVAGASVDLEDYVLGYAGTFRVGKLREALRTVHLLGQSRAEVGS